MDYINNIKIDKFSIPGKPIEFKLLFEFEINKDMWI